MKDSNLMLIPIYSALQMAQIEKKGIEQGGDAAGYMQLAAEHCAQVIEQFVEIHDLHPSAAIFTGKGNNGGDGFTIAEILLQKGYEIIVYALASLKESSSLNGLHRQRFEKSGGKVIEVKDSEEIIFNQSLIIDAILGTGFKGTLDPFFDQVITLMNESQIPIIAIDIPSGLNGNTGEVSQNAIVATKTLYLGRPKTGYFFESGMNHIGRLSGVDFGLDPKYYLTENSSLVLFDPDCVSQVLHDLPRKRHKYQRGYTLALAGSKGMYGAASMACLSALRSGTGIIRVFYREEDEGELNAFPLEVVKVPYSKSNLQPFYAEVKKASSVILGPGLSKEKRALELIKDLLPKIDKPLVLDADALFFLPEFDLSTMSGTKVLTPHKQELKRLLQIKEEKTEWELLEYAQNYVNKQKVILVFKGACSFILSSGCVPIVMPYGSPGMATAGSGDVLSGIIASMLSRIPDPLTATTIGVYLHQLAGSIAEEKCTSDCMIATDIIDCLPDAFHLCKVKL